MYRFWTKKSFWVLLVTVLVLLVIMKFSSSNRQEITLVERVIRDSYAPLQKGVDVLRDKWGGIGLRLSDKKVLNEQIRDFEIENNRLSLENMQLRENRAEVERLRGLLKFQETRQYNYDLEAARVIARSASNWYKIIIIDKGTEHGIKKGMAVINPSGLVGRVANSSRNTAQVWLITDREMAVGAILQQTRETQGIIEGVGDAKALRMVNIPYYSKVHKGEKVITSGLSEIYPKGIAVGTIKSVKREPNGLLLTASVTPAVDFDKLEEILVIKEFRNLEEGGG